MQIKTFFTQLDPVGQKLRPITIFDIMLNSIIMCSGFSALWHNLDTLERINNKLEKDYKINHFVGF